MAVTNGQGVEDIRTYMACQDNTGAQGFQEFFKALSGDIALSCSPATGTPKPTSQAWTQDVYVKLVDASGNVHTWYNGPVTIAINDTSVAGSAVISPAAGAHNMTDGQLKVTISGAAVAWLNGETVTLTASCVAAPGLVNASISNATCVLTFTT